MINYHLDDKFLDKIQIQNLDMNQFKTGHSYHIYGLIMDGRPPMRIVSNSNGFPYDKHFNVINRFFNDNGIEVERDESGDDKWIGIGLRLDVRKDFKIAARIVRTIVFYLENKLVLKAGFKFKHPEYKVLKESE